MCCYFQVFLALCNLALAAAANIPASYHPAPVVTYPDTAPVYAYNYAVADSYSGANFGQNEKRDGYATSGEYRTVLPDGRTQIVTYGTADAHSGNVADVKYEGTAHYPEAKPVKVVPAYHA